MKFVDFGAFQKITKMLSHDKILLHKLFGAFHDTSCNKFEKKADFMKVVDFQFQNGHFSRN